MEDERSIEQAVLAAVAVCDFEENKRKRREELDAAEEEAAKKARRSLEQPSPRRAFVASASHERCRKAEPPRPCFPPKRAKPGPIHIGRCWWKGPQIEHRTCQASNWRSLPPPNRHGNWKQGSRPMRPQLQQARHLQLRSRRVEDAAKHAAGASADCSVIAKRCTREPYAMAATWIPSGALATRA
eukprot:s3821_g1.t1